MTVPQPVHRMTLAEFLAWDETQPDKAELFAGEIFMMGGGTNEHNLVAVNVLTSLRQRLRGGPCLVYNSDTKVLVESEETSFYPDIAVSCDPRDRSGRVGLRHPKLIVEVLSPSTRDFDATEKRQVYQVLPSLLEYVLIDTERRQVEIYRRHQEGWGYFICGTADTVHLETVGLTLTMDEIYEDVTLTPRPRPRLRR